MYHTESSTHFATTPFQLITENTANTNKRIFKELALKLLRVNERKKTLLIVKLINTIRNKLRRKPLLYVV